MTTQTSRTARKAGIIVSAMTLAGLGATSAAAFTSATPTPSNSVAYAASAQTENDSHTLDAGMATSVANVQGAFTYDQNAVSSNATLTNMFSKAAMALCNSLPNYGVVSLTHALTVSGDVDAAFEATVAEMAQEASASEIIMACACASNMPAGGAMANADVSGVTLESVMGLASVH